MSNYLIKITENKAFGTTVDQCSECVVQHPSVAQNKLHILLSQQKHRTPFRQHKKGPYLVDKEAK